MIDILLVGRWIFLPRHDFGYSGKHGVATDESGLLYMRSRYYSPAQHQFLSADSYMGDLYHPLSLNPYSYVEGNPVRYIDPMGYDGNQFPLIRAV